MQQPSFNHVQCCEMLYNVTDCLTGARDVVASDPVVTRVDTILTSPSADINSLSLSTATPFSSYRNRNYLFKKKGTASLKRFEL